MAAPSTPIISTALAVTFTTTAAFGATMAADQLWVFTSNANCWIKQGTTPTAVAGTAGNMYVPANVPVYLDGGAGVDLAVVQDSTGGKASLVRVKTR